MAPGGCDMERSDAEEELLLGARDPALAPALRDVLGGVLALQLAQRRAMAVFTTALGLTESDVLALALLVRHDRLPVGALAKELGLTRGSASLLVTRLERSGLMVRVHDADDRRVVHIHATDAGVRAVTQVRNAFVAALAASVDGQEDRFGVAAAVLRATAERLVPAAESAAERS